MKKWVPLVAVGAVLAFAVASSWPEFVRYRRMLAM